MGRRGLSLLEMIVSLFLVATVVVVVANLFPSALVSVRQSEDMTHANLMAESLLDEQLSRPFGDLILQPETWLESQELDGKQFNSYLEVFQVGTRDTDYLKGLRVKVKWQHGEISREVVHEVYATSLNR